MTAAALAPDPETLRAADAALAVTVPADFASIRIAPTVCRPRSTFFTVAETSLAMVLRPMLPPTETPAALPDPMATARLAESAWDVIVEMSWAEILALSAWRPGAVPVPSPSIEARVARPILFIAKVPPPLTAPALPPATVTPAAMAAMSALTLFSLVAVTESAPVALTGVPVRVADTLLRPPSTGASLSVCADSS